MVERHLPLLIHLPARILGLRRLLSLDRQRKESEKELKRCLFIQSLRYELKRFDWKTSSGPRFFQYKYLDLFVENYRTQFTEQSNFLALVIWDCKIVLYPSVVFQPWPTSSYNVLLLLPYLGACRQNQTQTNTSRASLPAYRGAYIRTDRCINKKQKYLWKHIATVPKGHLALQTRSFHYIPAFNYIIMDDRKSSSFIRVGI